MTGIQDIHHEENGRADARVRSGDLVSHRQPGASLATSAEAWLIAGAPPHTVLTTAAGREAIEDLADMARIELLFIDADADIRSFA